ncbi:glycosyltransferase [Dyadobacter sp. MSC1_007]|jgi:glycosyltransferase involved in cell wall biosynthesis|uniref:glycosyltransferase n=1 Tax=Dyadobacter sp. MSC1_007 TaxID=2909264 RepID=UPI00202FDBFB|nr:glycosyltransferase [Dyadobacter sp. MSC1_007]
MKRVLLLSTVHPATDPRIRYKIAPGLGQHYELFCALPHASQSAEQQSITLIRLPLFEHLLWRLLFTHPVVLLKCLRLRPHLVHIFVPELIPVAFLFQWLGAKVIYEVQENLYKKFAIKRYNNHVIFRALFVYFDKLARQRFHCIFTDDAYLKEYDQLSRPFAVIHNYASISHENVIQDHRTQDKPEFFYLGVISLERCLDTLLVALSQLKEAGHDFHMHLFGPLRISMQELKALDGYDHVADNLTFYGYTDQKTALSKVGNALAGIALLKPVADYPESYPTKLFEYMAMELPVITSDFPIYREIVERSECGFCISPYDADALYFKLARCIEKRDEAGEMGRRGRQLAKERYNWASEEALLLSFYDKILAGDKNV